jgi:hypothetical protein
MMVAVPTLAHREERQKPIVSGIVAGDVTLPPVHVRERVDAKGCVIDKNSTR